MADKAEAAGYGAVFASVASRDADAASFSDVFRVKVLRNITVEGIDTLLKHHLYDHRIRVEMEFGGYGTMVQDVLDLADGRSAPAPDLIVLALALDELDPGYGLPGWTSELACSELSKLLDLLTTRTRALIAIHTFVSPLWSESGLSCDTGGRNLSSQVDAANRFVIDRVRTAPSRFVLVDLELYLRRLGAEAALDPRGRYLWQAPFKRALLDCWALRIARAACALKGRAKKCLVLDCDNTLWKGVIGEDGIDGIELEPREYPGRAFREFQASILRLAERGVLIALCSKNDESDVMEVLERHPHCLLRRSHLAAWRVNWRDKASNLVELSRELNLGLDAFVFVDDNPVECELVASLLPSVTVLQVPRKLHELPDLIVRGGLFDTFQVTEEDRSRAALYQGEARRKEESAAYDNLDGYLASLETVAEIHVARPHDLARIAQLTQKTNQFNLTTRRYAEGEIAALLESPDSTVYSMRVRDRFGTLGIVGVVILRFDGHVASIDTFLMSCRALGRRLEEAMLEHCLADAAARRTLSRWHAEYIATPKNTQVADFWPSRGFAEAVGASASRRFVREVSTAPPSLPEFIKIETQ
jgi:FkbH-like protein